MNKPKVICPFTGSVCTQCSLYRGRHLNLCYSGRSRNLQKCISRQRQEGEKAENPHRDIPDNN